MVSHDGEQPLIGLQRVLPRTGSAASYVAAAVAVAIGTLLMALLEWGVGEPPPYLTLYPAVVVAALVGGWRVGLAAAAVTLLTAWYFWVPTLNSFAVAGVRSGLVLATYAVTATFLVLVVGLARHSLDRAAASETERANAARESVHRIKNLIAVVQAISQKVARESGTIADYRDTLKSRLAALDIAQNVLVRRDWQDVHLNEIIHSALAPFLPNPGLSVRAGPDVMVPARHVGGLSMALYELCTNAMKYGALAEGRGPVVLTWRNDGDDCVLEWRETLAHGAKVERSGFGTTLIQIALSREPNTAVDYEITPLEVTAMFRWPAVSA
jgi:two-component sensor histidine kinase